MSQEFDPRNEGMQIGESPQNPIICLGNTQKGISAIYAVAKERGFVWASINNELFRIAADGTCEPHEITESGTEKIDVKQIEHMKRGNLDMIQTLLDGIPNKPTTSLE